MAQTICEAPLPGGRSADGFQSGRSSIQNRPFAFTMINGDCFAFAGLWGALKDPATGEWLQTSPFATSQTNLR